MDELREHVRARYGLQSQQVLRRALVTAVPATRDIDIDDTDVPF